MMTYFAKQRLLPSSKIPYRPERTEQLADPSWWHSYMQPLHHLPSVPSSSIHLTSDSGHRQRKLHFKDTHGDLEEHRDISEMSNIASNSSRLPSIRKTSPEIGSDLPIRQNRLIGQMRRELSFEDSTFGFRTGSGHRQVAYETGESPDSPLKPQENPNLKIRYHSWREWPDRTDSTNNSQRQLSQRQSDDIGRNKLPHLLK